MRKQGYGEGDFFQRTFGFHHHFEFSSCFQLGCSRRCGSAERDSIGVQATSSWVQKASSVYSLERLQGSCNPPRRRQVRGKFSFVCLCFYLIGLGLIIFFARSDPPSDPATCNASLRPERTEHSAPRKGTVSSPPSSSATPPGSRPADGSLHLLSDREGHVSPFDGFFFYRLCKYCPQ